jgi:hypothetical protein
MNKNNSIPNFNYQEYLDIQDSLLELYSFENEILHKLNLKNINLSELIKDTFYIGECRNADLAFWNGKQFFYIRTGWAENDIYIESINHTETETFECADVFLPFARLTSVTMKINDFFIQNKLISKNTLIFKENS